MGFYTVRDGEMVIVWKCNGSCKFVRGPKRFFTAFSKVKSLALVYANQNEYLSVQFKDGHIENIPGPTNMFLNPLLHSDIKTNRAISLTANELLVVYRRYRDSDHVELETTRGPNSNENVERLVIRGPCIHVPDSDEWIHDFEWHGEDPNDKTRILPGIRKFQKLKIIPDQFYYNIVRCQCACSQTAHIGTERCTNKRRRSHQTEGHGFL